MNARQIAIPTRAATALMAVAAAPLAAAALVASAPPAAALERLLPEEDRLARAVAAESAPDDAATVRFFDLLPGPGASGPEGGTEAEPADQQADPASETAAEAASDGDRAVEHEIGPGETLADVARVHGIPGADGWRRIFDANPELENPDLVEVGTVVRVPAADEVLEERDLPAPPPPRPGAGTSRAGGDVWDQLAACESGGSWGADTGNGYYGGLQFSLRSWQAVGGPGMPHEQPRETQIAMGQRLQQIQGWGAWPACSRKLGLR